MILKRAFVRKVHTTSSNKNAGILHVGNIGNLSKNEDITTALTLAGHCPLLIPNRRFHLGKGGAPPLEIEWHTFSSREKAFDNDVWNSWVVDKDNYREGGLLDLSVRQFDIEDENELLAESYDAQGAELSTSEIDVQSILASAPGETLGARFRYAFWSRCNNSATVIARRRFRSFFSESVSSASFQAFRISYRFGTRMHMGSLRLVSQPSVHNDKAANHLTAADRRTSIIVIRRKKMNKHKWKKLRRRYRNSKRFSRSKRKRNRERLIKEYKELGLEFGRKK